MTKNYLRDSNGRFVKGTPQPAGFGKGKQKIPWNYKGGCVESDKGYRIIYKNHKKYYEHRYIWEQNYGTIPNGNIIHHKDGNKLNNDIENLECMTIGEHNSLRKKGDD